MEAETAGLEVDAPFPSAFKPLFQPMRYKVFYGGRGGAKCLALGTRVIMADGSLRHVEAVTVGEQVMGPDSKPRTVLATSRGTGPLFKVRQTSGIEYVVNDDHILSLKKSESSKTDTRPMASGTPRSPNGRYPGWADITNIPVQEALAQSARWKSHFRGYRAGLIEFPHQPVAIDPYFLGAWLGDGTSREMRITTADEEIVSYCRKVAERVGGSITVHSKTTTKAVDVGIHCQDGRENRIWQPFKAYGLPNNKHIPQAFIANTEENRLELLAGLIDTDGHYRSHGYGIIQVNERLARDIKYLADTLGFRTNISKRKTFCSNNGATGVGWFVSINGDVWRIPCKIPRKQAKREEIRKNKDFLLSQVDIEPHGVGEWAGFTLDGDHLFCLEDGTVTHNSWAVARALLILGAEKPLRILCAREFQTSIDDSVHRLLSDQVQALGLSGFYQVQKTQILGANGTLIVFEGLRRNINSLKSFEGCDICWVEEATDVSKTSWDVLIPTIRKTGSEIWISFNPELDTDETYTRFVQQPPTNSVVVKVNWEDNPWFPDVLRHEMEDLKARDHDSYLTVWEGHCRQSLDGAVYAKEIREATSANRITRVPYEAGKPVHTFWDLGKSDNTAIWFAQVVGFEFRVIDYYQNHGHNLSHYVKTLGERPYAYGTMWLPHDATHDLLASERTIEQQMRGFGFNVRITPKTGVATGIEAARTIFGKCWFDAEKTSDGIQCLRHYHYERKQDGLTFGKEPVHNWASHGADAFRYLAVAMQEEKPKSKQSNQRGPQGTGAWLGA